jgi:cell division protein ZapE
VRSAFDVAAAGLGSVLDKGQEPAAARLARLAGHLAGDPGGGWARMMRWRRRPSPVGVYLHGPVGRGKTWLVDTLLAQLPPLVPRRAVLRVHVYDLARGLHREVARRAGIPGAVDKAVDALLDGVRLVFLDELHAHDPGDAMLLTRVVRALPGHGAVLVATSNYPPRGLLPDPRHHHLVLPLVAALETHCEVVAVDGPVDHRRLGHGGARPGWSSGAWLCPGSASQLASLGLAAPEPGDRVRLMVGGRPLWAAAADGHRVHLHFTDLCAGATSTGDLLELTDRYRTLVLGGVPALSTVPADVRRRFADLVDVAWDRDTRLVVLADGPPAQVLDAAVTDRDRLVSRLHLLDTT